MPTLRVSSANVSHTGIDNATEAMAALREIRASLGNRDGTVRSGYLTLSSGPSARMERSRLTLCSSRDNARAATEVVRMVKLAYGDTFNNKIAKALATYLDRTGGKFGTQSFASLLDHLELAHGVDLGRKANTRGRLDVTALQPDPLIATRQVLQQIRDETNAPDLLSPQISADKISIPEKLSNRDPESWARQQIEDLTKLLLKGGSESIASSSMNPAEVFVNLLKPLQVGKIGSPPAYVLGDSDGSVGRMVLLGIQSGHIGLDAESLELLADLLHREAIALRATTTGSASQGLKAFQSDPAIGEKQKKLVERMQLTSSPNQLIYIGDILHDRLSNNKPAMKQLIEKLADHGAVFILGNHDVFDECFEEIKNPATDAETQFPWVGRLGTGQSGEFAHKQLSREESESVRLKFKHAYFDEVNNTLYTHNGIEPDCSQPSTYDTFLGKISATSPKELATKMNTAAYDPKDQTFTEFRPHDSDISDVAFVNERASSKKCRFVHGHDGCHNGRRNVVNLNARSRSGFSPVGCVL